MARLPAAIILVVALLLCTVPGAPSARSDAPGSSGTAEGPVASSVQPAAARSPSAVHPAVSPLPSTALWEQVCADRGGGCSPQPTAWLKSGMAWDPADNYTILFGGQVNAAGTTNQTWVWNGTWSQLTISHSPQIRSNFTLVWDATDAYAMLFGGWTGSNYRADTWKFLSGVWTGVTTGTAPSIRSGYAMVYVPSFGGGGGYVLLFGGNAGGTKFYSDTWEYAGGTWTNITTSVGTPPAGRSEAGIAYDAADHYVVLWGGLAKAGLVNDTWEFNPLTLGWTQLCASASTVSGCGPKKAFSPEMTYDPHDLTTWLADGSSGSYASGTTQVAQTYRSVFSFNAGVWTNQTTAIGHDDTVASFVNLLPTFAAGFAAMPPYGFVLLQGGRNTADTSNGTFELGTLLKTTLVENIGEVLLGGTIKFWANATNGGPPYTYLWTLPSGCIAGNVSTFTCTPTATGWNVLSVTVTDNVGATSTGSVGFWVDGAGSATITLSPAGSPSAYPPSTFWALDWRCSPENNPACVTFVQQTPVHWFRVAGSMEGYNATTGLEFARFGGLSSVNWNWTDIAALCRIVTPCNTVAAVPTQNNDTGLTYADMEYILQNYSYSPTYVSLGNEPEGWVHFLQGFSSTPYPQPYSRTTRAQAYQVGLVENRIAGAVLKAEPGAGIIIDQDAGGCSNSQNIPAESVLYNAADGSKPVFACHAYPAGFGPIGPTVTQFLSPTNLTRTSTSIAALRLTFAATCAKCSLPIWVTEFNGANSGTFTPYLNQWPDTSAVAANVLQFLALNVSQFEYFDVSCGAPGGFNLLLGNCTPTPVGMLYTQIFDHLRMSQVYNVSVAGAVGGVYAIETRDAGGSDMLIVNTNTTVAANVQALDLPAGFTTSVWAGSPALGWTTASYGSPGLVPATWTVPAGGVLLVSSAAPAAITYPNPTSTGSGTLTFPILGTPVGLDLAAITLGVVIVFALLVAVLASRSRGTRRLGR